MVGHEQVPMLEEVGDALHPFGGIGEMDSGSRHGGSLRTLASYTIVHNPPMPQIISVTVL